MSVRASEEHTIVIPSENSENTLAGFYADLSELLECSPRAVLLDCSLLHRATSNHVSILCQAHQQCVQDGTSVRLVSVSLCLERVLKVLDLYDYLGVGQETVEPERGATHTTKVSQSPASLRLEFRASVDVINDAMKEVRQFLARQYISEIQALELETVFYEAATNIHFHGCLNENDLIVFTADRRENVISLCFTDPGLQFDPSAKLIDFDIKEAIRDGQRHGFGMPMIKRMTDIMSYERKEDRLNVLTLVKKLD